MAWRLHSGRSKGTCSGQTERGSTVGGLSSSCSFVTEGERGLEQAPGAAHLTQRWMG